MLLLKHITTILHILFAAAWFGLGLRLAGQARKALSLDRAAGLALATDGGRTIFHMNASIVLTTLFAYATLFLGGAGSYGPSFHISSTLILVLVAVQFFLIRPGWKRLTLAIDGGTDGDAARKRIAMGTGIGHLLWMIILVLMFWPRLQAALAV